MTTLTIGKILNDYQDYFTDYELEQIRRIQRESTPFAEQVKALRNAMFGEEWDFMGDSISDAKSRSRGENPMSQEYSERVNKKRAAFGVSPLSETGGAIDETLQLFCEDVVRLSKNYKELKDLKFRRAKQVVFVDMDGVLVNFQSGIDRISEEDKEKYAGNLDEVPGIFSLMDPNEGAIAGYKWLSKNFDTYIFINSALGKPIGLVG